MCGIFGLVNGRGRCSTAVRDVSPINRLFRLSETVWKEASGLTLLPSVDADRITVFKSPADGLGADANRRATGSCSARRPLAKRALYAGWRLGNTRPVTNGSQLSVGQSSR